MATSEYAQLIKVKLDANPNDGCFVLSCAALPGLLLAGHNLPALLNDVPAAIKLLYRLNYQMEVEVIKVVEEVPNQIQSRIAEGWMRLTPAYVAQRANC